MQRFLTNRDCSIRFEQYDFLIDKNVNLQMDVYQTSWLFIKEFLSSWSYFINELFNSDSIIEKWRIKIDCFRRKLLAKRS